LAKLRGAGSRVVVPLQLPSFSTKFTESSLNEGVRRSEMEPDISIEIPDEAAGASAAPIKLGKRAFLPSDEPVKQSKASAAMAIADANKDVEFEEMRPLASEAAEASQAPEAPEASKASEAGKTGAEGAAPKMRVIRPPPKRTAVLYLQPLLV
jgi:hypothetical protein